MWLGNNRGTRFSRQHISLDADADAEDFWNFSHHEFALSDVPTMTNEIIKQSGTCTKVSVLGHSLGNLQFWYGLALKP